MTNPRLLPYRFKNGKTALNRVVVPPMASQTANARGGATAATVAHYNKLAGSGAGIVFVEYSFVHTTGRGEERQLGIDSDSQIRGLSEIAAAIHSQSALAGIQIVHVGGKTTSLLAGGQPIGASAIAVPVRGWDPEVPRIAARDDIENQKRWYVEAAFRAKEAGFDLVELHAAHGYGLNQWLSPLTNQRKDSYGGSIENRARLLLQIAARIKQEVPELLLAVRLPGQDNLPGGLTPDEMIFVATNLQNLGVDLIDISSGLGGWRRTDGRASQGYLVADAAFVKGSIQVPVVGVGGILDGSTIDQFLLDGKLDFAAVGRAILGDPEGWRTKFNSSS